MPPARQPTHAAGDRIALLNPRNHGIARGRSERFARLQLAPVVQSHVQRGRTRHLIAQLNPQNCHHATCHSGACRWCRSWCPARSLCRFCIHPRTRRGFFVGINVNSELSMWQARCEALLTHLPLLHMPGRHSPTHASSVQAVEGSYFKQPLTSHQGREISSSFYFQRAISPHTRRSRE